MVTVEKSYAKIFVHRKLHGISFMHFGEKAWLTLFLEVLNSDALVPQAL
jgi:hypothetical protein